jgi:hypothetical protein
VRPTLLLTRLIVGALFLASCGLARSQDAGVGIEPFLRLEKPKYVLGEAIRFWVGVKPRNSAPVPEELVKPCSLAITKPDGTIENQSVNPPPDRMRGAGWGGGWGFGKSQVMVGVYFLVLECGGEKTKPVELTVERNEIFDQIKAQFTFERSGEVSIGTPVPVILTVQNDSEYIIRFPERGVVGEGVGVSVDRAEPRSHSDLFYPWAKLSNSPFSVDTYSWDATATIPSIVLKPGEHFVQQFSVEDAYSFDRAGLYEITFSTVLPILAGEKNGPFVDLCPFRLPVVNTAQFTVMDSR